jgi:hypothetical protein
MGCTRDGKAETQQRNKNGSIHRTLRITCRR